MADEVKFDLKHGMNAWVEANTTITGFSEALGYRYPTAWSLLRGKVPVTVETVGRFALAYGPAALGEMLDLAGLADNHEVHFTNGVPVAVPVMRSDPVYTSPVEVA
jgi:hypothetical protein